MPWCFKIDTFGYDDNDFDEDDDGGCGSGGDDDDDDSCDGSGACVDADNDNNVTTMVLVMSMMLMLVLTMKVIMLLLIMAIMMIMLMLRNDQYVTRVGAVLLPNRVRNPKGHPTYRISKINLEGSRFQSLMGTYPLFPDPCLWGTDIFILSLTYTDFLIFPRGRDSTQQT